MMMRTGESQSASNSSYGNAREVALRCGDESQGGTTKMRRVECRNGVDDMPERSVSREQAEEARQFGEVIYW